ncbi:MAG: DNA topoisomerase, partial [Sulfobacillus sp.]|nr:DNA topoisomerase [Sulfobacillus sp.]
RVVNDAQVAAAGHYAIIPTGHPSAAALTDREQAVFDLIVRRFLAALMPPGRDERVTVWTEAAGERFKTTGTTVWDPGWRAVWAPDNDPDASSDDATETVIPPGLQAGQGVTVYDTAIAAKKTTAPSALTDASLLTLMEQKGLGTPATRARIVETLIQRGYVERVKKTLKSTAKAQHVLRVIPDRLQSPDLTGQWEARLEAIAHGQEDARQFLADIRQFTREIVAAARQQTGEAIGGDGLGLCPVCHQGQVLETPKGWGCSRWKEGCRFVIWKTVAGKRLTTAQVKTLLAGKTTRELTGFQTKAGRSFAARLRLDDTGRVVFVRQPPANAG